MQICKCADMQIENTRPALFEAGFALSGRLFADQQLIAHLHIAHLHIKKKFDCFWG